MKQLPRYLSMLAALLMMLMAFAQSARADNVAAEALFADAKKLMDSGKFAEACPKLEESQRLDPGMGTQFHLAYCYEKVGKTASAWSLYLEVAGAAKAVGQVERERVSRASAATLEKKLSRLIIQVPAPADGIAIKRDNTDVSRVLWGTPVPIDPGEHIIVATAPNKKTWENKFTIGENAENKTVEVPAMEDGPKSAPIGDNKKAQNAGPTFRRRSKGMMAGGIIMMSIGAPVFVVGGLVFLACDAKACDGSGAAAIVGGLLTAGGIALTVTGAEKVRVDPPKASLVPSVFIGPRAAAMRWTF